MYTSSVIWVKEIMFSQFTTVCLHQTGIFTTCSERICNLFYIFDKRNVLTKNWEERPVPLRVVAYTGVVCHFKQVLS